MKTRHSFRDIKTGQEFRVELEIDVEGIAHTLAARAFHAKSGKATVMDRLIVCAVVARREPEQES